MAESFHKNPARSFFTRLRREFLKSLMIADWSLIISWLLVRHSLGDGGLSLGYWNFSFCLLTTAFCIPFIHIINFAQVFTCAFR